MKTDILIVGAGIVGAAAALKIKEAAPSLNVTIVEKESACAKHQTGNNSGVIHSGIYYKPGSQKALNCRRGYELLLEFCRDEGIEHDLCGKIIVASTPEELPLLENIYQRSQENGLTDVYRISGDQIKEFEPHAIGLAALVVPYTGIIDYTAVTEKYLEIFTTRYDGKVLFDSPVDSVDLSSGSVVVSVPSGEINAGLLVNTAGLYCDKIAMLSGDPLDVRIVPFRGEYMKLAEDKTHLVKNLIYPVPNPDFPFLGVHFTRMIEGGIEAGPNAVLAFRREGYKKSSFDLGELSETLGWPGTRKVLRKYWREGMGEYWRSFNKRALVKELQKLVPDVSVNDLVDGGAGVRAQACTRDGKLVDDFMITENEHFFNVLNAPSPAATSSLAIGEELAKRILARDLVGT